MSNCSHSIGQLLKEGLFKDQRSILGLLLFLIYIIYNKNIYSYICINDLSDNFVPNPKLFANDIFHFSVVSDKDVSAKNSNNDLNKINTWVFRWKTNFNLQDNNQVSKIICSCKIQKPPHPPLIFNNNKVTQLTAEKYLGMFFITKTGFQRTHKNIFNKVSKTIGLLRKLHMIIRRSSSLRIY